MKVYKFKNKGIGKQAVTIPTDSEYMIGIEKLGGVESVKLYDGETELSASFTLNNYVLFQTFSGGEPATKEYKAVLSGETTQEFSIVARIVKSSQSFIDSI